MRFMESLMLATAMLLNFSTVVMSTHNVSEVAATSSEQAGWVPTYVDYLYLSLTNSSAFSPTDTMPLSTRAKALMGLEATAALLTTLLVIARAVGSLTG